MNSIIKKPSAWIPIALSVIVIGLWVFAFSFGATPSRQPDEGTAAHLFQIWLVLEVLLLGFFAVKWLPKMPKQAVWVLAIQIILVLAGCFPVYYFKL
ncbi:MAG: hypothetical protein P4L74_04515 [Candidatus Doudnabacteria bacterium]|nr:hypothetical protein [Candidatus Doudnabacteria bacterium]